MLFKFCFFEAAINYLIKVLAHDLKLNDLSKDLAPELEELINNPMRRSKYISDRLTPQQYLAYLDQKEEEISAGPLLGVAIGSIFTGLTQGLVAGGLALLSGVIQIILNPPPPEPARKRDDPNFAPVFGSAEGTGSVVRLGQTIPAIFCSRSLDPTGGYTTGGTLINARIDTIDGNQTAYLLYSIGHGEIGNVDLSKTLINNQPVSPLDTSITMGWKPGRLDDQPVAEFADLSQNIAARTSQLGGVNLIYQGATVGSPAEVTNLAGFVVGNLYTVGSSTGNFVVTAIEVDVPNNKITFNKSVVGLPVGIGFYQYGGGVNNGVLIGTLASSTLPTGSNSFFVPTGDIDSYTPGNSYLWSQGSNSGEFKVLARTFLSTATNVVQPIWRVDTDVLLPDGIVNIHSINRIKYRTTRRVNQADLNFVMKVWGRDSVGSLIDFAQSYILRVRQYNQANFTNVCRFYVRSFNARDIYRSISVVDLSLYTYDFEIVSEAMAIADGLPLIELKDSGNFIQLSYAGYAFKFQGIQSNLAISDLNNLSSQLKARVPQHSGQGAATIQLLHVNEREYVGSTPRPKNLGYPGLACIWVVKRFTIDTNGQLQFQFFIPEGIIVESLLAAGTASAASTLLTLRRLNHGLVMAPGLKIRNIDKGVSADITAVTPNEITTSSPINWEQGDRWYAYGRRSTCWWPEIKAWLLRDPKFGASKSIDADFDLHYPSMIKAVKYCSGANEFNQSFAWHGSLGNRQRVAEVDAENCIKVNLYPIDIDGSKGYWCLESPDTVGIFNIANADDFRVTRLPELELDPPQSCTITYKEQQQSWLGDNSLRFLDLSVTAAVQNESPTKELTFAIPECTSRKQAVVSSMIKLNYGRFFGKSQSSLQAKQIEAVSLELGGLIRVQLHTMDYNAEQSGIVIEVDSTTGKFRIDNEFMMVRSLSTDTNSGGITDAGIDFIAAGVVAGDLVRNEESGQISAITAVATHSIACLPAIPIDTYYQIADLTTNNALLWQGSANKLLPPLLFTTEYLNNHIWYSVSSNSIEVGDVVQIGSNAIQERLFQVLSIGYQVSYDADAQVREMSIPVIGAGWDSRMFKFDDLKVTTIDDVV